MKLLIFTIDVKSLCKFSFKPIPFLDSRVVGKDVVNTKNQPTDSKQEEAESNSVDVDIVFEIVKGTDPVKTSDRCNNKI